MFVPVLSCPIMQPQYGLRFINKVKDPTYTTEPVRDNNGDHIRVEIYNFNNRSRASPDCFFSYAKVRLTVLNAEFWKNKGKNWSRSEFNQSVLSEREGKGPILIGPSLTIRLENGVGTFGNIFFNDNSSWTKSGFRLGVMVEVDEGEGYYLNGERVQEGVTEPFHVRDRRTEGDIPARYKQHPPIFYSSSLNENISTASASDLFPETNPTNVETGNILNRNSVHHTNGADAESSPNYNTQVPSGGGSYGYRHGRFPRFFPRRDTAALWNCPRGLPPPSCQDRSIIGDIQARYGQRPPICDSSSLNVLNEHISTASALFPETNVREEIHVREELGNRRSHYILPPPRGLPYPNMQPQYGLRFINKAKDLTYTTKPVSDNNGDPIRVELYDYNRSRVSFDCFLSSAKVRITVLDADFWKNRVNWSRNVFVQNVLKGREGKEPILIGGSPTIQLENGVGTFGNIVFNDNSSWTKCGFRLGVMVEGDGEEGYYLFGERVQEGVSEPFQVRDRRTEASKKPDLLKPKDSVKYIKKIGKDRASLLQKENINTVEDFLKSYCKDEAALREILGIKSETGKQWVSMVQHVKLCADQGHAIYNTSNNSSQPRQALVPLMERNSTNGERPVVGSGSSKQNHSENDRIEGNMAAINGQSSPIWDPLWSSFLNENGESTQTTNGDGSFQYDLQFGP